MTIRIKTGPQKYRRCVYWDNSLKENRGGRKRYHHCWRADVTIIDARGLIRIRRRFKDKNEAYKWLEGY